MKVNRQYIKKIRYTIQWAIFAFILYVGYVFYLFVRHFETDNLKLIEKPPSIEGFLPIGALMSFRLWITNGIFDRIHPAALIIFISALIISLFFRKAFCGWICPVGTVSELTFRIGKKLFGKNLLIPGYLDYALRTIKYLLMGFFIYTILFKMNTQELLRFVEQPYWKISDVKLLKFFTDMSTTTMVVLFLLFTLSLLYKNFWCRYLCPYGALLGLLSLISPFKINRNDKNCTHCHRCTEHCPYLLPVEDKERIISSECNGCLICVAVCPSKDALDVSLPKRIVAHPLLYIGLILTIFFGITNYAKYTDHWKSDVTYQEYKKLIPNLEKFEHP